MHKTIYKTCAVDSANIIRMTAQGHTEKESLEFCKSDLINDQFGKGVKDYWRLNKFKFETIIIDSK